MIQAIVTVLDFAPKHWSSGTQLVAIALADRVNGDTFECWPSIADVCRRTRMDRRTVQRHIRTLEQDGVLTNLGQRIGRNGHPASNVWRWNLLVTLDRGAAVVPPQG